MSKKNRGWQKAGKRADESGVTSAGQERHPYLYRYLRFPLEKPRPDRDGGSEMLKDVLVNRRVRASNPLYFNDPWDCKPRIHPDLLKDPELRQTMAESFVLNQKDGPKGDPTDRRLINDPAFLTRNIDGFNDFMVDFIRTRWGIICLTIFPCSTLMWSHYSDNHKGVCLQFRVHGTVFQAAAKVLYRGEYPKMVLGGNLVNHMLIVKAKEWEKEAEYRLICSLSEELTQVKESPLIMKDGFLPIDDALHAVIMGCEIGKDEEAAIKDLLKTHAPHVRLKRAVRVPHNYLLKLEDVNEPQ